MHVTSRGANAGMASYDAENRYDEGMRSSRLGIWGLSLAKTILASDRHFRVQFVRINPQ